MSREDDARIAAIGREAKALADRLFDVLPTDANETVLRVALAHLMGRIAAGTNDPADFVTKASDLARETAKLLIVRGMNDALLRYRKPEGQA